MITKYWLIMTLLSTVYRLPVSLTTTGAKGVKIAVNPLVELNSVLTLQALQVTCVALLQMQFFVWMFPNASKTSENEQETSQTYTFSESVKIEEAKLNTLSAATKVVWIHCLHYTLPY